MESLSLEDSSGVAKTLKIISEQMEESFAQASRIKWKRTKVANVVVAGMGGSNLASEMIRSVFSEQIKTPFILVRDYFLPSFVNKESLVIISSYSGNTEETLNCYKQALAKKAKIFVLASGGSLLSLAKRNRTPFFQISLKYNPSKQPRYGIGSQLGVLLAVLKKTGIVSFSEIKQGVECLKKMEKVFGLEAKESPAKSLAKQLKGRLPVIIGSEFLSANARILNNQINESAKNLAYYYFLPELNHHLLDGLKNPPLAVKKLKFIFLYSNLLSERILKRIKATQKVLTKQKISFVSYKAKAKTKFTASLEILIFGSYLSFYLSRLNQEDPARVEWVDYFKKELAK
ncbi:MAG: SIS domain-containing protein [Patescibacteria group bacterium]